MSKLAATYSGQRGALFGLALKTSVLTFLSLGIYRFWAKTRVRKYIWSSISLSGDRLEYTGTGLEKFLGFLVAVVVLAVYIGLVQIILFYFGLHFVFEPKTQTEVLMQFATFYISFLAILPLMLFARYRSRRYMLARTRLRGIRFGMDTAAWGYVWRAILHGALSMLTLGILLPRQTFWLEKYKTDRTWYGETKLEQGGKWTALYPAMVHILVAVIILFFAGGIGATSESPRGALVVGGLAYVWGLVGYAYYRVHAFRYLTANKSLGASVRFEAEPRTASVVGIVLLGGLAVGLVVLAAFAVVGGVTASLMGAFVGGAAAPGAMGFVIIALLYLFVLALVWAMNLIMVIQPLIAHFAETLTVLNADALVSVRQRAADSGADAGGFADALDVGAAI